MVLLSKSLTDSLRPPRIRNAADWANTFAYLPEGDAHEGKFRCRKYQEEILKAMSIGSRMNASGSPVREVVLLKSAQIGYTISLLHAATYTILHRPTNIGFYFPHRDSAVAFSSNQASKYWDAQPTLLGKISSEATSDGKSSAIRKHFDGGTLRFLSANKPSDLATHSFGFIVADEIDLIKDSMKEGSAVELITNRAREFSNSLIVWGGTPRGSYNESRTWSLYNASDKRRFHICCPKCGKPQYLSAKNFEIGQNDYNDSGFRCTNESCNHLIKESEKYSLLKEGFWKATATDGDPGRAGFHINAFYSDSPTCSWPNLARLREACGYDKEKLKVFINTYIGLPASPTDFGHLKAQDIIEELPNSDYATVFDPTQVPNDVSLITIGCDVQGPGKDARLEYSVYGWNRNHCYFLNHLSIDGDVLEGKVWDEFREAAMITYTTIDKKKVLKPALIFVDSGNGQTTLQVYRQCSKFSQVMVPVKGNNVPGKAMVVKGVTPSTRQPLVHIQTAVAKDRISGMLKQFVTGDPNKEIHFPHDLDTFVASGLTSEYRTIKPGNPPKVLWIYNGVDRNEPLDCLVYSFAAKEYFIGGYDPDVVWPAIEKRANKQNPRNIIRQKNYDGWY